MYLMLVLPEEERKHEVEVLKLFTTSDYRKNIKWKFIRNIGPAWSWVESHSKIFLGEVMEPVFLQMDLFSNIWRI